MDDDRISLDPIDVGEPRPLAEEPLRLRGWAALGVGVALMVMVGLLIDPGAWRVVVAGALIAGASQVGGIEWAHRHVWSPASVAKKTREAYLLGVEARAGRRGPSETGS